MLGESGRLQKGVQKTSTALVADKSCSGLGLRLLVYGDVKGLSFESTVHTSARTLV